jgi:hypothetical protein
VGRTLALVVATVAPLAGAVTMVTWEHDMLHVFSLPAGLLVLSAALAHHGRTGSQLLARGVWWANLVLGTLFCLAGSGSERSFGLTVVLATGAPLLAMGRMGLDEDDEGAFRPLAFRRTLSLAMIMAVADAQALLFWGVFKLRYDKWTRGPLPHETQGVILLLAAAVVLFGIVGLYRLRVWGLVVGAVSALGLIALAMSDVCGLEPPLPQSLVATSAIQLLLPVPIIAAIVRGRAPAPSPPSFAARLAPQAVVALLVLVSVTVVWAGVRF